MISSIDEVGQRHLLCFLLLIGIVWLARPVKSGPTGAVAIGD